MSLLSGRHNAIFSRNGTSSSTIKPYMDDDERAEQDEQKSRRLQPRDPIGYDNERDAIAPDEPEYEGDDTYDGPELEYEGDDMASWRAIAASQLRK